MLTKFDTSSSAMKTIESDAPERFCKNGKPSKSRVVSTFVPTKIRPVKRNRVAYAAAMAIVMAAGLASRSVLAASLPGWVTKFTGDTLWALLVFLLLGFVFPQKRIAVLALAALAISFAVEVSQLYRAEWINQLRASRIGSLVLGRGWMATDLICYTVGIFIAMIGETILQHRRR